MYKDVKNVCLYARYSSTNQTEQSIEGQVRVCREFCERQGFTIVETYIDRATSASKDIEKRVDFLRMIKDSEKHEFEAVVVYKLDRFARSRYDSAHFKYKLKKNGVQLISATENISNDPEGIILESVLEGMAEFYSAELAQKISRGMHESAMKHNATGGKTPLGYKIENKKWVIDEDTAQIVREAFQMYADGHTIADICRTFRVRGYKTAQGKDFGKSSFSRLFSNERYIGTYKFGDYQQEDAMPAIISKELFNQVKERMKIQAKPGSYKAKQPYLLSGKLYCGHCGNNMQGGANTRGYSYYQCGRRIRYFDCNKRNMPKKRIEEAVVKDALSLLTDENIALIAKTAVRANVHDITNTTNIPTIKKQLHETEVSLANIAKAIETGVAPETLVKRMVELESEKKTLVAELKREEGQITILDEAQVVFWLEQFKNGDINDPDFQKRVIDLFINRVTAWDEDDKHYRLTIAYNLSDMKEKTYHLQSGGRESDTNAMPHYCHSNPTIVNGLLYHSSLI